MNLKIPVTGETTEFKPANGTAFTLEELQSAVGGNIEFVPSEKNGHLIIVNEEGHIHGLPFNTAASFLAGIPLVGDALVVEEKYVE